MTISLLRRALLTLTVALSSLGAISSPALAWGPEPHRLEHYYWTCLDASSGTTLLLASCNQSSSQSWRIFRVGVGAGVKLRSESNGKCLDGQANLSGQLARLTDCRADVDVDGDGSLDYEYNSQWWIQAYALQANGKPYYILQNANSTLCLARMTFWSQSVYLTTNCRNNPQALWTPYNVTHGYMGF